MNICLPGFENVKAFSLNRSTISRLNYSFSDFIFASINKDNNYSLASYIASNMGYLNEFKHFLLVEPTNIIENRNQFLMSDVDDLDINTNEANYIIERINNHFNKEIELFYIKNTLFLIGFNFEIEDYLSYPSIELIGHNILDYLPKTELKLNQLITEIQMVLFDLDINKKRKSLDKKIINNLWLWDKLLNLDIKKRYNNFYVDQKLFNYLDKINNNVKIITLDENFSNKDLLILTDYNDLLISKLFEKYKNIEKNFLIPKIDYTIKIKSNIFDKYKFWKNNQLEDIL